MKRQRLKMHQQKILKKSSARNKNMSNGSVEIIGVASDLGANTRGANMGPAALRTSGLNKAVRNVGFKAVDSGDITASVRETFSQDVVNKKYIEPIGEICQELYKKVHMALENKHLPLVLGGDHCVVAGSISASSVYHQKQGQEIGLLWFDAHADLNTPTSSETGNVHGMPLSALLGDGFKELAKIGNDTAKLKPENCALIGIRCLDEQEKKICAESGIRYFTMREIDERGMHSIMKEAIEVATKNTDGVHVSFDLDGVDPLYAPGVSTPVTGGLSYRESHLALEMIADTKKLVSMDFVELNPMNDSGNKSAKLMIELIQSVLGKSIV